VKYSWKIKKPAGVRQAFFAKVYNLQSNYVCSLQALGAFLNGEFNPLAFLKVAEAITLDGGEMYEYIRAIWLCEKSIAFASVEPLDCSDNSFRHRFAS
jgi:hypothetical protein